MIVRDGSYTEYDKKNNNIYCYSRMLDDKGLLVIANFKGKDIIYKLPKELNEKKLEVLISNYQGLDINNKQIKLKPYQVYVYKF